MDYSTFFITDDFGNKFHLQRWEGQKNNPAIVLLHDALGSIPQWKLFPSKLAQSSACSIIAFERLGHGQSSQVKLPQPFNYLEKEALQVLPFILQALQIHNPILLGHSDGGTIALIYAAYYQPLAVIAISPHIYVEEITLKGINTALNKKEKIIGKLLQYHGEKAQALFNKWSEIWLHPAYRQWNILNILHTIHCPIQLIQGMEDEYGSSAQLDDIKKSTGNTVSINLLPKEGHAPHVSQTEKVVHIITSFLHEKINFNHN